MHGIPNLVAPMKTASHYPSAATAAVVTLAAEEGVSHCLRMLAHSYSATPTGGKITIVSGSTTIEVDVPVANKNFDWLGDGIYFAPGAAVVITLASGAGAVVGKLSVIYQ